LGPYEIRELLGSGGMGEVYRAIDVRLQRDIALKVLSVAPHTADSNRLERFRQEALATAALNHPNIVSVYDASILDGIPYVVCELLEGATLRDELRNGPRPIRLIVDYGQQIARGLAAAHERGIVHRDLKPENLFVTRDGRVKILDFGLAKLRRPVEAGDPSAMPTGVDTAEGVVLGSVGYMAPEQVRGLATDHRSDVFSFGAILYEMSSGMRAFRGATTADTLTAILREEPPELSEAVPALPPALARIIIRCLHKDPSRRFQSASDLAFALEALSSPSGSGHVSPTPLASWLSNRRALVLFGAGAVSVLAVAAVLTAMALGRQDAESLRRRIIARFVVPPPDGVVFNVSRSGAGPNFGVSPDGGSIAFVGRTATDTSVWVRPLDSPVAVKLPGTEAAVGHPFWSPDGLNIAFFTATALKVVELARSTVRTLCERPFVMGTGSQGTWGSRGTLLVSMNGMLLEVPATGGECSFYFHRGLMPIVRLSQPQFLPDGEHFIIAGRGTSQTDNGIFAASLDRTEEPRQILDVPSSAAYAGGHLLFVRDGLLVAQPFDVDTLQLSGTATPIGRSLEFPDAREVKISAAEDVVVYTADQPEQTELVWVDRSGRVEATKLKPASYGSFDLSPDDSTVAISQMDPNTGRTQVWSIDLTSGSGAPVSTRTTAGAQGSPVFSHDGGAIVFTRTTPGRSSIVIAPIDGGPEQELVVDDEQLIIEDWAPDRATILYRRQFKLLMVSNTDGAQPAPFDESIGFAAGARFSPADARVAYVASRNSTPQIFVTSVPVSNDRRRTAIARGVEPRWRRDGQELFYRATTGGDIMALDMSAAHAAVRPMPRLLVASGQARFLDYDVTSNGQKFLVTRTVERKTPDLTAVVNWKEALRQPQR
jgi:serine/threonine protein kinase/Tol biopolymer transport system component